MTWCMFKEEEQEKGIEYLLYWYDAEYYDFELMTGYKFNDKRRAIQKAESLFGRKGRNKTVRIYRRNIDDPFADYERVRY